VAAVVVVVVVVVVAVTRKLRCHKDDRAMPPCALYMGALNIFGTF